MVHEPWSSRLVMVDDRQSMKFSQPSRPLCREEGGLRLDRSGFVQAVQRDADVRSLHVAVGQRRPAFTAEPSLDVA